MPVFRSVAFHIITLALLFSERGAATPGNASIGRMTLALAPQVDAAGHPTGIASITNSYRPRRDRYGD